MRSETTRGVLLCLIGTIFLLRRFLLGAPLPWPIGYAFIAFGAFEFWRAAQYRRNRSDSDRLLDQAEAVRKKDPVEADRLEDQAFVIKGQEERRAIERLRQEARYDPHAARELADRLEKTLKLRSAARQDFETSMSDDPRLPTVLRNIEEANAETQQLLDEARNNLRQLKP